MHLLLKPWLPKAHRRRFNLSSALTTQPALLSTPATELLRPCDTGSPSTRSVRDHTVPAILPTPGMGAAGM